MSEFEFLVQANSLLSECLLLESLDNQKFKPKRVTSGGIHLGLAPGQHSSEKTSQRWRAVGDAVPDLTGPGIEPQTSRREEMSEPLYQLAGQTEV